MAFKVAYIELIDKMEEFRAYNESSVHNGMVHFTWDNEAISIPIHRVKSITETKEH